SPCSRAPFCARFAPTRTLRSCADGGTRESLCRRGGNPAPSARRRRRRRRPSRAHRPVGRAVHHGLRRPPRRLSCGHHTVARTRAKVGAMSLIFRVIAVCALAAATTGCAVPYYWQAIGGQLELLRKREPIEEVIADPSIDATLKDTLTRIAAMRRFAVDELQ